MAALVPFLIFCQAFGAVVGAVTAVWGELAYIRAMKDGKIDHAERAHLAQIGRGLRFGMVLILVASLGLVVAAYAENRVPQPALSASYWMLVALALLVTGVTWALSRKKISFALGSALVFTGWWFLVFLTLGKLPALTFGAAAALFVVSTAILYGVLRYLRFLIIPGAL